MLGIFFFCVEPPKFFLHWFFSLDCPCCMLCCPKERSCCPQAFLWSPALVTLRHGLCTCWVFFLFCFLCGMRVCVHYFVLLSFRTDIIFQVAEQLSHCSLVEPLLLPSNLLTLFCRYLDKRTVHQLKSNMEWVTYCQARPQHIINGRIDLTCRYVCVCVYFKLQVCDWFSGAPVLRMSGSQLGDWPSGLVVLSRRAELSDKECSGQQNHVIYCV